MCAGYPRSGQSEERSSDDGARSTRVRMGRVCRQYELRSNHLCSICTLHLGALRTTCVSRFVSFTVQLPEKELIGKRNWHVRKLHVSRRNSRKVKPHIHHSIHFRGTLVGNRRRAVYMCRLGRYFIVENLAKQYANQRNEFRSISEEDSASNRPLAGMPVPSCSCCCWCRISPHPVV